MMLQFTPYSLAVLGAGIFGLVLALLIWQRRPGAGVLPFVIMSLAVSLWSLGNTAKLMSTTYSAQYIFIHFVYLGITLVPASWVIFVLEYTGRERWVTPTLLALLAIEPLLVQIAIATNDLNHFFWTDVYNVTEGSLSILINDAGTGFWLHAGYSYVLLLVGTLLLIQSFVRSPRLFKGQIGWLLVGAVAPWIANAVFIFKISPLPEYIDITPMAFTITCAFTAWSMYRFRLWDIVPVAKDVVFESLSDAVFVLDSGSRIVDANPVARKLLASSGRVVGSMIPGWLEESLDATLPGGSDTLTLRPDLTLSVEGSTRNFALRRSSIVNRNGDATGQVIVLHDITALTEANRELVIARQRAEDANRLKTQFLATMSHELRTPLNAISGFTEILLEGMAGDLNDRQHDNLSRVFANAKDLRILIDDILDLAKIEAGRTEIINKPFVVREWLNELIAQTSTLAEEKGLAYQATLGDHMPEAIIGDPARLKQIAVNLISNAVKFTESGEVRVEVIPYGPDHWAITVTDTGIGIPSHAQEFIFDRFRQVDGSSQRKQGGSGLGLAIVRELALMMGGSIRVSSTPGEGSTFTVTMPLNTPDPVTALSPQAGLVG